MRSPFNVVGPYAEGFKILENYTYREAHPHILNAFDCELTIPAQMSQLTRVVKHTHAKYTVLNLKNALNIWKYNTKDRGQLPRLRKMFDDYVLYNSDILMAPYKDICEAIIEFCNRRNSKTGVITDFLRGIKDIPNQLRAMKRTEILLRIINKGNRGYEERLRSALMDWVRRARGVKQESCSEIIQKFIRDKLKKRMTMKDRLEKACEHTKYHIWNEVMGKIRDYANRNILKDILLKYFNMKHSNNMKVLKDKFNNWNNLIQ